MRYICVSSKLFLKHKNRVELSMGGGGNMPPESAVIYECKILDIGYPLHPLFYPSLSLFYNPLCSQPLSLSFLAMPQGTADDLYILDSIPACACVCFLFFQGEFLFWLEGMLCYTILFLSYFFLCVVSFYTSVYTIVWAYVKKNIWLNLHTVRKKMIFILYLMFCLTT